MFKGGFGEILQQAHKMKEEMQKIQEGLAHKTVEAVVGGGMVKVIANGKQQIVSLSIDPEIIKKGDTQMIQDLTMAAVNQALKLAQEMMAEELKGLTGGLGMLNQFFK